MIQFSQINLNGLAPVAIEMREFIQDRSKNDTTSLDGLIKYISDNRKFTVGYSPRDSEYYGPFSKTDFSPKNYDKFEGSFENLLLKIKNTNDPKIINAWIKLLALSSANKKFVW